MKRLITKILTATACAAMVLTAVPATNIHTVQAAANAQGTIDLKAKKLTIPKGKTQKIKNKTLTMVKNRRYQVKTKFGTTTVTKKGTYKSSKPVVATVSSTGLVTAKAPGTATISVTYNGTKQTFKVKVTASHKHAWKTTRKATCANTGKKLCQTCGVTGTTAKKTTHTWKTTKKATCQTAGKKTCTVCGTAKTVAKTGHNWKSETWTKKVGLGKPNEVLTVLCNECYTDMTHWTNDERNRHLNSCHAGTTGTIGRCYKGYEIVEITETWCRTCGIPNGNRKERTIETGTGTLHDHHPGNQDAMFITDAKGAKSKASAASVATFSDGFAIDEASEFILADTDGIMDTEIIVDDTAGDEIVADTEGDIVIDDGSEDIVISDNNILSDNETGITDLETGGEATACW